MLQFLKEATSSSRASSRLPTGTAGAGGPGDVPEQGSGAAPSPPATAVPPSKTRPCAGRGHSVLAEGTPEPPQPSPRRRGERGTGKLLSISHQKS